MFNSESTGPESRSPFGGSGAIPRFNRASIVSEKLSRQLRRSASPRRLLSSGTSASPASIPFPRRGRADVIALDESPTHASPGQARKTAWTSSLLPDPTRPAMPTILPAHTRRLTGPKLARRGEAADFEKKIPHARAFARGHEGLKGAADHHADQLVLRRFHSGEAFRHAARPAVPRSYPPSRTPPASGARCR